MSITKLSKFKIKKAVIEYLSKTQLCALATTWKDQSWSATVFFACDNKFNLLFFSKAETRHCVNIAKNWSVSVAINQGWVSGQPIQGLQLLGQTEKVLPKDLKKYYKIYKTRYSWADEFPDHTLYIIKPTEIHYIDQKLFGHFYRVRVM